MLENEVKVNEECNLEHHKRNEKLLNSPFLNQWIVKFNDLLNTFFGEDIVLICICKLGEEVVAQFIFVVVDSRHVEELSSDGFLHLTFIAFFYLLDELIFKVSHVKP